MVIIKQNGTKIDLFNRHPICSVVKAEHRHSLLSENVINLSVESKIPLDFNIGDKIDHYEQTFTLNTAPRLKREQGFYNYDLTFESRQYLLRNKILFNLDKAGFQTSADFSLTSTLHDFLKVLLINVNSIYNNRWVLKEFPTNTEAKTLSFNNENCLAVLQKLCNEYNTEFEIKESQTTEEIFLNIKKIGQAINYSFQYGFGNGLYSLQRENINTNIITRLYAYGSNQNINKNYRGYSQRLRMPTSDFIQDNEKVASFGLTEAVKIFDDIKPTFKGVVSEVKAFDNNTNTQELVVSNMDFDLNEVDANGDTKWLLNGTSAKLHFNKGNLAGYDFDLSASGGYIHDKKTFKIKQWTDDRGQKYPDPATILKFAQGDEFTILNINLPQQYITNAENKLLNEARKEYEKISKNNAKYTLSIDPMFFKSRQLNTEVAFSVGDYISITDKELNINKTSRIISLSQNLLEKHEYNIDIADNYEVNFTLSVLQEIKDTQQIVKNQQIINIKQRQEDFQKLQELRSNIFDNEGYFDIHAIKPQSIDTNMLSVGARNQQFNLENVTLQPNIGGNPEKAIISEGKLVHLSIASSVREWNMRKLETSTLTANKPYYVYAKCGVNDNFGVWHITTERLKFDEVKGYYHFLCFLIYSEKDKKRTAEALYGSVFIHGGQITAGRIKSANGNTYFDLDNNEIGGTINFKDGLTTGKMIVGKNNQANAGLNGLGGDDDIFLWGGDSYENRHNAEVWMKRNGHFRLKTKSGLEFNSENGYIAGKYDNGKIAFKISMENGFPELGFYKKDGTKVYSLGEGGIYYVREIAESFQRVSLLRLPNKGFLTATYISSKSRKVNNSVEITSDVTAYIYNAGENPHSEANKYYNGYKSNQNKYNNIADGWYAEAGIINNWTRKNATTITISVRLIRVNGGKATQEELIEIDKAGIFISNNGGSDGV